MKDRMFAKSGGGVQAPQVKVAKPAACLGLVVPETRALLANSGRSGRTVSSPPRARRGLRRGVERWDPILGMSQPSEQKIPHLYPLPL